MKGGLIAAFINPKPGGGVQYFDKAFLLWDENGIIEYFSETPPATALVGNREILSREGLIAVPGLIDLHTHLPQYEFAAQGAEALLPWLEKYTFPQESRFADPAVAELQSLNFFQSCLAHGTTTVVAYLSSFGEAADIAFAEAGRSGIRAYLGLTLMDRNVPAALLTDTNAAGKEMQRLIGKYHKKNRTEFVVTPRFAISCTGELLALCGEISRAHDAFLQTHISENTAEVTETLKLFPEAASYAGVYDKYGCLHGKSLLGHGIHLTADERQLVRERGSVIVHCPVSNNFLGSGILPYAAFRKEGLRLALGTDVAAGYSLSMLHEAKQMTEMAKLRGHWDNQPTGVSTEDALFQATLGNAAALGRENDIGSFEIGKHADLALIDDRGCDTLLDEEINHYASLRERLNRVLYRPHTEMVVTTLIDGEAVFAR